MSDQDHSSRLGRLGTISESTGEGRRHLRPPSRPSDQRERRARSSMKGAEGSICCGFAAPLRWLPDRSPPRRSRGSNRPGKRASRSSCCRVCPRARPALMESRRLKQRALVYCFVAFSSREPVSTSLENALAERALHFPDAALGPAARLRRDGGDPGPRVACTVCPWGSWTPARPAAGRGGGTQVLDSIH